MTTIDDVLAIQASDNVLSAPTIRWPESSVNVKPPTLTICLHNSTTSKTVYAYITGLAINNNYAVCLIRSDGATVYYPANPSKIGTELSENCAIPLGAPGTTVIATIPYIAGGRVWFSVEKPLTFLLNPSTNGPGLVEPSVSNTSDPNYYLTWDFCEFTYNSAQIYANISYVDFVCLPVALTLYSKSGASEHVGGLPSTGLAKVCEGLIAQNALDGAGWNQLVISNKGEYLRALSPLNGMVFNKSLFQNYWTNYVSSVWNSYISKPLRIDTQSSWGVVTGYTSNDRKHLVFSGIGSFTQPAAGDIFGGSSGAFAAQASNTAELLNIGARLDAGFNRSTLLIDSDQPDDEVVSTYYRNSVTNHYARIVHAANVDGRGYCFPYDDVSPTGGADQSGFVSDPTPSSLVITIGGANAFGRRVKREEPIAKSRFARREVQWVSDVEENLSSLPVVSDDPNIDLEKGALDPKLLNEMSTPTSSRQMILPAPLERIISKFLVRTTSSPLYITLQPFFATVHQFVISVLSLSTRAILSRVFLLAFILLVSFLNSPRTAGFATQGDLATQRRILEGSGPAAHGTIS